MNQPFLERKRTRDGREKVYECSLIYRADCELRLEHVMLLSSTYRDGPFTLPAGEVRTRAFYWSNRNYLAYCLYHRSEGFLGTRFDICKISSISESEVVWEDYILDLWAPAVGGIFLLDESEYRDAVAAELLSDHEQRWIEQAKRELMKSYSSIISPLMED